jgi:hypothetical protein
MALVLRNPVATLRGSYLKTEAKKHVRRKGCYISRRRVAGAPDLQRRACTIRLCRNERDVARHHIFARFSAAFSLRINTTGVRLALQHYGAHVRLPAGDRSRQHAGGDDFVSFDQLVCYRALCS